MCLFLQLNSYFEYSLSPEFEMLKTIRKRKYILEWIKIQPIGTSLVFQWFSSVRFSSVQFSSVTQSCPTFCDPMFIAHQASLSITNSWSSLKLMSIELVMPSSHLILCRPLFLLPPVPPSILGKDLPGSFPMSQLFAWGGQNIGVSASASVLPMNTQDWSPLGWTGWISLSPRDSQESSPTPQFKSINSSVLSFLHSPTLTSIHDHRKNNSLD